MRPKKKTADASVPLKHLFVGSSFFPKRSLRMCHFRPPKARGVLGNMAAGSLF
jgi:hypothetical protein